MRDKDLKDIGIDKETLNRMQQKLNPGIVAMYISLKTHQKNAFEVMKAITPLLHLSTVAEGNFNNMGEVADAHTELHERFNTKMLEAIQEYADEHGIDNPEELAVLAVLAEFTALEQRIEGLIQSTERTAGIKQKENIDITPADIEKAEIDPRAFNQALEWLDEEESE